MNILVTGGAGYIGSHACRRLLADGHSVTVIDNLFRGHAAAIDRLRTLPGVTADRLVFQRADIADRPLVERLLRERGIQAIIHFAALAYVGESVQQPLKYWEVDCAGALSLLAAADAADVRTFIFSSTCATYGEPPESEIPIRETTPQRPINPYGAAKLAFERILSDYADLRAAQQRPFAYALLRYFNVAGCDPTGLLGEDHTPETHLIPVVLQTILGQRPAITIFGTDYPTPDGTCIRDYIHVDDLVDAHVAVMNALKPGERRIYNLGIGKGCSVRQIIDAARRVTGRDFKVLEGARRPGDPPTLYCDPSKIRRELGWTARITDVDEIVATAWRWFERHPRGYAG